MQPQQHREKSRKNSPKFPAIQKARLKRKQERRERNQLALDILAFHAKGLYTV